MADEETAELRFDLTSSNAENDKSGARDLGEQPPFEKGTRVTPGPSPKLIKLSSTGYYQEVDTF
jgi:hypothetical protein